MKYKEFQVLLVIEKLKLKFYTFIETYIFIFNM